MCEWVGVSVWVIEAHQPTFVSLSWRWLTIVWTLVVTLTTIEIGLIPDLNVYLCITQLACTSQRDNTNAWKRAPGFDPIYDIELAMKFSISLLLIKKAEDNARRPSINWCYTITILKFWLMSVISYNLVLPSMKNVLFLQRFYMNNRSSVLISQPSNLNWFFNSEVQQGCYKQARGVRTEFFFFFFLW